MNKYFIRLTNRKEGVIIELKATKVEDGVRTVYVVPVSAECSVNAEHPDYTEYWHYRNHKEMTQWSMSWNSEIGEYEPDADPEDYEIMELREFTEEDERRFL